MLSAANCMESSLLEIKTSYWFDMSTFSVTSWLENKRPIGYSFEPSKATAKSNKNLVSYWIQCRLTILTHVMLCLLYLEKAVISMAGLHLAQSYLGLFGAQLGSQLDKPCQGHSGAARADAGRSFKAAPTFRGDPMGFTEPGAFFVPGGLWDWELMGRHCHWSQIIVLVVPLTMFSYCHFFCSLTTTLFPLTPYHYFFVTPSQPHYYLISSGPSSSSPLQPCFLCPLIVISSSLVCNLTTTSFPPAPHHCLFCSPHVVNPLTA